MAQQKTRRRKRDEEEPEQLEDQSEELEEEDDPDEDVEEDSEEFDEEPQAMDGNEVGLRLREDAVEIELPRDGNESKTLHAIADMLDSMS
jgi:hypothetical protein